jgi:hypothetical protein
MKITIMDKNYNDAVVDTETATISELNEAYTYLLMMSDSGGAFPGSAAWREAQEYRDMLNAMIAERPEVEAARRGGRNARAIDWDKANNI